MTHNHENEDHDNCCHEHHHDSCCSYEHHHHEHHESFSDQLLELADEAWMEVLKDKIKEQIKISDGKNLDELAKIVSESNNKRWDSKLSEQTVEHSFKDNIEQFFKKK